MDKRDFDYQGEDKGTQEDCFYKNDCMWKKLQSLFEGASECDKDLDNIVRVLPYLLQLQYKKSRFYGRSYCKHGELSIFFNTERKWDRLSYIMEKVMNGTPIESLYNDSGMPTETFFDTVVDLASYSLLWVGYIVEHHPEVLDQFIDTNKLHR